MITVLSTFTRLGLALILGSLIGLEREKKGRSAGLRTHILVCVGSALIMLISIYIHDTYGGGMGDPGRIAAGVITGIGFLGAGTIIRSQEGIRGLTTAASVWISAGIGLAVGCGFFSAALGGTAVALLTLYVLKRFENI